MEREISAIPGRSDVFAATAAVAAARAALLSVAPSIDPDRIR